MNITLTAFLNHYKWIWLSWIRTKRELFGYTFRVIFSILEFNPLWIDNEMLRYKKNNWKCTKNVQWLKMNICSSLMQQVLNVLFVLSFTEWTKIMKDFLNYKRITSKIIFKMQYPIIKMMCLALWTWNDLNSW